MPKQKKTPFPPWQTAKPDGIEGRYIRAGNSQLLHVATMSLSDKAFRLYVYMLLESGGKKDFTFSRSKYTGLAGHSTFIRARDELIQKGFIAIKVNGANLRKENIYTFCEDWKHFMPP